MPAAPAAPPPAALTTPAPAPSPAPAKPAAPAPIAAPPSKSSRPTWDSLDADLRKVAGLEPEVKPAKPAERRPGTEEADTPPKVEATPDAEPSPDKSPTPPAEPAKDGKKQSPWRLVDQLKAERLKLATEVEELRKRALPEDQWKQTQERLTAAEKRAQEYEDEIRYTNYQKSKEFTEKYQQPYEKAWKAALGELSDVTITDATTGQSRRFQSEDMLGLLNLTLPEARKMADELYGPLADDVMAHRKTIRELFDAQTVALEDAKKNGATRDKERQEKAKTEFGQISKTIREAFEQQTKAILDHPEHGKWFKPVEGDEEGNKILEKGMEFAKSAFITNPLSPNLKPEQRIEAARKHAAVIARAGVYGVLRRANTKLAAEVAALKKENEQFKASVPGNGSPKQTGQPAAPKRGIDGIFSELDKLAS